MEVPQLVFKVLTLRELLIAACWLGSRMVAKEARHQILNYLLDNDSIRPVSCWDRHRDPRHGLMVCFPWLWREEEKEDKCRAFVSWFKNVESDKYDKIKGVTKGNVNECIVNELKCCVNKRKRLYEWKHHRDAFFLSCGRFKDLGFSRPTCFQLLGWTGTQD